MALDDLARQPLGNGGFAHAGIAHIERVVLRTAAEDLDCAVDFRSAADEWIDLPAAGLLIEVYRELVERAFLLRSEEHTSELQSLMRTSYDVFCLKKKKTDEQ